MKPNNFIKSYLELLYLNNLTLIPNLTGETTCSNFHKKYKIKRYICDISDKKLQQSVLLFNHHAYLDIPIDKFLFNKITYIGIDKVILIYPLEVLYCIINGTFSPVNYKKWSNMYHNDPDKFTNWIKKKIDKYGTLAIYPAGDIYKNDGLQPIKTGFIKHLFRLKIPIQIVWTYGKENMCDYESKVYPDFKYKVELLTVIDKYLYPNDYNNEDEWVNAVINRWNYIQINKDEFYKNKKEIEISSKEERSIIKNIINFMWFPVSIPYIYLLSILYKKNLIPSQKSTIK